MMLLLPLAPFPVRLSPLPCYCSFSGQTGHILRHDKLDKLDPHLWHLVSRLPYFDLTKNLGVSLRVSALSFSPSLSSPCFRPSPHPSFLFKTSVSTSFFSSSSFLLDRNQLILPNLRINQNRNRQQNSSTRTINSDPSFVLWDYQMKISNPAVSPLPLLPIDD